MKTTKPFSTISYNTADFLKVKLDELVLKRHIAFYVFIEHFPEEDERKKHIHLYIIPNGQVQTDQITDLLQELDREHPDCPPLGVMPWRGSKFSDWYLYSCHDVAYLASKGQAPKHPYIDEEFATSNKDYLHELVHTIDRMPYQKTRDFVEKVKSGKTLMELVEDGDIAAPQFNQWSQLYSFVRHGVIFRGDYVGHEK